MWRSQPAVACSWVTAHGAVLRSCGWISCRLRGPGGQNQSAGRRPAGRFPGGPGRGAELGIGHQHWAAVGQMCGQIGRASARRLLMGAVAKRAWASHWPIHRSPPRRRPIAGLNSRDQPPANHARHLGWRDQNRGRASSAQASQAARPCCSKAAAVRDQNQRLPRPAAGDGKRRCFGFFLLPIGATQGPAGLAQATGRGIAQTTGSWRQPVRTPQAAGTVRLSRA